jgi:hypothetical protein
MKVDLMTLIKKGVMRNTLNIYLLLALFCPLFNNQREAWTSITISNIRVWQPNR